MMLLRQLEKVCSLSACLYPTDPVQSSEHSIKPLTLSDVSMTEEMGRVIPKQYTISTNPSHLVRPLFKGTTMLILRDWVLPIPLVTLLLKCSSEMSSSTSRP